MVSFFTALPQCTNIHQNIGTCVVTVVRAKTHRSARAVAVVCCVLVSLGAER